MTEDQAKAYTVLLNAIFGEKTDFETLQPASDQLIEALDAVLGTLTSGEDSLIRSRFGLADGEAKTMAELSQMTGKSEDDCRQIETDAISKLRHPSRSDQLREFLD